MSRRLDIKYPLDDEGNEYIAVTHTDAVIGLDITTINEGIAINLSEILALKTKVESLEIENVNLKNKNTELENRIIALENLQGGE